LVFHAGTVVENNELVTNGGRVLAIGAVRATLEEALERAYEGVDLVWFDNMHYRSDIGATLT
jgi:phosphoribosylamine-glycine ligase